MLKNIFSGKKSMRCPLCGSSESEKLEDASTGANDIMGLLESQINAASPELARYNKHTRFQCGSCGRNFNETVAIEWQRIADKFGDKRAINEYKKFL